MAVNRRLNDLVSDSFSGSLTDSFRDKAEMSESLSHSLEQLFSNKTENCVARRRATALLFRTIFIGKIEEKQTI